MIQGIAILGLNGCGKSTLAHALSKQTGYYEMDVEDYYFPEQRDSLRQALDIQESGSRTKNVQMDSLVNLPYSVPRTKSDVETLLNKDIESHPYFILSGVTMNWGEAILSHIDIAFGIKAPLEERLQRIQAREKKRFGTRVLEGGDMFVQQREFHKTVKMRNEKVVEDSVKKLYCPVIVLDIHINRSK